MYIAVHGGAGFHGYENEKEVKNALRESCKAVFRCKGIDSCSSITAVEEVIAVMEDDGYLNAGYGSNLTLSGGVECDASIMNGRGSRFGSVGAVSGIKNPIRLARSILDHSTRIDKLGRVPPLMLVADGARSFAQAYMNSNQVIPPEQLVTEGAFQRWQKWKERLQTFDDIPLGLTSEKSTENIGHSELQDTVGAVAWCPRDGVAAGVSSGGILLKFPGRIGEAATYGAGCWAQEASKYGIACSVSGTGEYIIRANLAHRIGELFRNSWRDAEEIDPHEMLNRVVTDEFWGGSLDSTGFNVKYHLTEPARQNGELEPSVGILLLTREETGEGINKVRLWCAFTTKSMAIAYASSQDPKPKAMILRRPNQLHSVDVPVYIMAVSL